MSIYDSLKKQAAAAVVGAGLAAAPSVATAAPTAPFTEFGARVNAAAGLVAESAQDCLYQATNPYARLDKEINGESPFDHMQHDPQKRSGFSAYFGLRIPITTAQDPHGGFKVEAGKTEYDIHAGPTGSGAVAACALSAAAQPVIDAAMEKVAPYLGPSKKAIIDAAKKRLLGPAGP